MYYTTFAIAFLLSLMLIPLNILIAPKLSLVDTPNSRRYA